MIKHVGFGCLMMHDMRDLQCLNVGITPGCYKVHLLGATLLASPRGPQRNRRDAPDKESLCEPVMIHGCVRQRRPQKKSYFSRNTS